MPAPGFSATRMPVTFCLDRFVPRATLARRLNQGGSDMWRVKSLDAIRATAQKTSLHRSLGLVQLTLLGIGGVIGTGIFVLTAVGAQKAGPGLMLAFAIAGAVCIVAALCYAEIAAMIPVAGSAYTYTYANAYAYTNTNSRTNRFANLF